MSALPPKADIAVGKESSLKEVTQAQLGLDNRQFELCALQRCSSPGGIAAVIVSYSALRGRYPVSCRSKSPTVYRRGSGRARFFRGPLAALLAAMIALNYFPVATHTALAAMRAAS